MQLEKNVEDYLNERANILSNGIFADFTSEFIERVEGTYDGTDNKIISPVEQLFLIEWSFKRSVNATLLYQDFDRLFELFPQYSGSNTGKYRIDFVISFVSAVVNSIDSKYYKYENDIFKNVNEPLLGIEIDGHIWHEKTKTQVRKDKERERFLISKGWKLLRYTGSEIFNNVSKCVDEVHSMAYDLGHKYLNDVDDFISKQKG